MYLKSITIVLLLFFGQFSVFTQNIYINWQKSFGGSETDKINSFSLTSNGGLICAGQTKSNNGNVSMNNGGMDCWIINLSAEGNILWEKCYGGSNADAAFSIIETANGEYVFAGYTLSLDGDVSGYHGQGDFWVVKLDANGEIIWQKCFGGSDTDGASFITEVSDLAYIVVGSSYSSDMDLSENFGSSDYWVIKIDYNGDLIWEKNYGGSSFESACSVLPTPDNGLIIASRTESTDGNIEKNNGLSDIWVVKIDSTGDIEWENCYGGTGYESACSILQTEDGNYIISGTTDSNDLDVLDNHGGLDIWLIKITMNGDLIWQKCFGGSGDDYASTLIKNQEGYTIGGTTESEDGDISNNNGSKDFWLINIEADTRIIWQKCFGGSDNDQLSSIIFTNDSYFIAGNSSSMDGDVNENKGMEDIWIFNTGIITYTDFIKKKEKLMVYPNPFNEKVTISFDNIEREIYSLILRDLSGRIVKKLYGISGENITINRDNLSPGIYTFELSGGKTYTGKLLVN